MKLILATRNVHKSREIAALLGEAVKVLNLHDIGFEGEIIESGNTFEENARIKLGQALEYAKAIREGERVLVLADDSGLEVDALEGAPGVISARYAGEPSSDAANTKKLLKELKGLPALERRARFRCVLAVAEPGSEAEIKIFQGTCEGKIGFQSKGENGFGYDPIFFPEGYCRTFAELTEEEKNEISHRAKAMAEFITWLEKARI